MELQLEAAKHSAILAVDQSTVERSPFMYTDTHDNHFGGIVGSQDYKLGQTDELKKALLGQPSATIHLPQWGKLQALIVTVRYTMTQAVVPDADTNFEGRANGFIPTAQGEVLQFLPFKLIQQINFKTETGNVISTVYLQDRILEYAAQGGSISKLIEGRLVNVPGVTRDGTPGVGGIEGVNVVEYKFAIPFEFFKCASTWPDLRTLTRMDLEFIPNSAAAVDPLKSVPRLITAAGSDERKILAVLDASMVARYVRANELVEQEVLSAKHPSMRAFMRVAYSDAREQRVTVTASAAGVVPEIEVPIKCQQPVVLTRIESFVSDTAKSTAVVKSSSLEISSVRIEDSGQILYESDFDVDALTALQPFSTSLLREKMYSGTTTQTEVPGMMVINHGLVGSLDLIDKDMYSAKSFYQMSDPRLIINFKTNAAALGNKNIVVQVSHLAQQAVTIQASENMRNREIYKVGDK